jgi:hypothetical protein
MCEVAMWAETRVGLSVLQLNEHNLSTDGPAVSDADSWTFFWSGELSIGRKITLLAHGWLKQVVNV